MTTILRRCALVRGGCPVLVLEGRIGCTHHMGQLPPELRGRLLKAWDGCGKSLRGAERVKAFAFLAVLRQARAYLARPPVEVHRG